MGVGAGGDYSKEGSVHYNEDRSGITQLLKFHLPFPYRMYVGECDLKTEGKALGVCVLFYSAAYPA